MAYARRRCRMVTLSPASVVVVEFPFSDQTLHRQRHVDDQTRCDPYGRNVQRDFADDDKHVAGRHAKIISKTPGESKVTRPVCCLPRSTPRRLASWMGAAAFCARSCACRPPPHTPGYLYQIAWQRLSIGVDLSTAGVDLSMGGVDLSMGGVDLSTGGVDLSMGGVDLSTG